MFTPTDSPLRPGKRGVLRGSPALSSRLPFSSTTGRYLLYVALLLTGFLAGSYIRAPALGPSTARSEKLHPADDADPLLGTAAGGHAAHHQQVGLHIQRNGRHRKLDEQSRFGSGTGSGSGDVAAGGAGNVTTSVAAAAVQGSGAVDLAPANRTLRFQVCNGFGNQRLCMMYGILLARRLGRSAVLPVLVDNGLQRSDDSVLAGAGNEIPFSHIYDGPYFVRAMAAAGVRVLAPEEAPLAPSYTNVSLAEYGWAVLDPLRTKYGDVDHLAVDCVLFRVMPADMRPEDTDLVWAVLGALRPNKQATALLGQLAAAITQAGVAAAAVGRSRGGAGAGPALSAIRESAASPALRVRREGFNFLHLRIENDWVEHCSRWGSINDGMVRDNCYNHTEEIGARLALFGLSNSTTLYVASYWEDVDPERRRKAFDLLADAGYTVVTSADVFPPDMEPKAVTQSEDGLQQQQQQLASGSGREHRAMLEYFLGMRAERFIGNSVSTFSALALFERRHRGQWAAYYNGGNVPLSSILPALHRLPWVFTYNSWSPSYEYMLKAAVRSALFQRSLVPYCIFMGDPSAPIATWLQSYNVTLIRHSPAWRDQLLERARAKAKDNVHHSHLFKTPDMLVATFQRVDLPVVPLLDQYTYVLYTDADVYFRKPIRLDDFGLPLPQSVSMSYEFTDTFPYNAGVMLANLPAMRLNYQPFIRMMLDNDNGLYYNNYGPADQGILNKYYEADLRARMLSQTFNTKPYSPLDPSAFIVHFHGPKPHDLLAFLTTGKCDFYTLCESLFTNSVCKYAKEWVEWLPDEVVALRLEDVCNWLEDPVVAEVFKKKWGLQGELHSSGSGGELSESNLGQVAEADSDPDLVDEPESGLAERRWRRRMRRALRRSFIDQYEQQHRDQQAQKAHKAHKLQQLDESSGGQSGGGRGAGGGRGRGGRRHGARMRGAGQHGAGGGGGAQGGSGGVALKDFDTFKAIEADEGAVEAAWDAVWEQGDGKGEGGEEDSNGPSSR